MTGNTWLPTWLRIVALAGYALVILVHLRHLRGSTSRCQAWHAGHLLMAFGMIVMFLPTTSMIVPAPVGEALFVGAAAAVGAVAAVEFARHRRTAAIWAVAVIDLAAMAYMFAGASLDPLTWLLVGWFVLQSLCWAAGSFEQAPRRADDGPRTAVAPGVGARTDRLGEIGDRPGGAVATAERSIAGPALQPATFSPGIRASLAVMALGMAYMLLAMRLGMPVMDGPMPGM